MEIHGSIVNVNEVEFAIVAIRRQNFLNVVDREKLLIRSSKCFPKLPIVLMVIKKDDTPMYYGREDLVQIATSKINFRTLHWKHCTIKD